MKTKTTLTCLILFLLIGCKGRGGEQSKLDIDIYKGTDSLVMNFLPNAPPDKVFEKGDGGTPGFLPIGIELYNKGAHNIENGYLSVILEKNYMSVSDTANLDVFDKKWQFADDKKTQLIFSLNGRSLENQLGDSGIITFGIDVGKIDPQSETHKSDVLVSACYRYETKLGQSVCIDDDVYNIRPAKKACSISDIKLESQGAPVAITKIETKMLPAEEGRIKPQVILYIENKGRGDVIDKDKISQFCSSNPLDHESWNKITPIVKLFGQELNCIKDELKMKDKKGMIICTLEEGTEKKGAFKTPLEVALEYGYMFTISKTVTIEKALTY